MAGLSGTFAVASGCGSSSSSSNTPPGNDASATDSSLDVAVDVQHDVAADTSTPTPDGAVEAGGMQNGTPTTFNVFDHVPQFGVYVGHDPTDYTPPPAWTMWSNGTVWVTQLSATQQSHIGADVAARITYYAQCDNYDRLGGIFLVVEPKGQKPQPTDPRIEIVRFITPFSDYTQGALATHVYPNADISPYAQALADTSHDVWVGIAGGSNPYGTDPCAVVDAGQSFAEVGFLYSLDLVSSTPLTLAPSSTLVAISDVAENSTPIDGGFPDDGGTLTGNVTVLVSGHGSAAGGDEYNYTFDSVTVNGQQVGTFSTMIDCAPFAQFSPDGNPGIFQNNTNGGNPRNWCPGAFVPPHTFKATLGPGGMSGVGLTIAPPAVPSGSYYQTSITFTTP